MSYCADEQYDAYDEQFPRARKEHRCSACRAMIPGGTRYARIGIVYNGSAETIKRCLRCQRLHEHLRVLCSREGDMWPDEKLNCGERYEDEWGDVPDEIAELAFLGPVDVQTTKVMDTYDRHMDARKARRAELKKSGTE